MVNNIVYHCRWAGGVAMGVEFQPQVRTGSWGDAADVIINNNLVSAGGIDGVTTVLHKGVNYKNNAAWSATTGVQKHISGNPDPLLDDSYALTVASPAKDAGVDLSSCFATDKHGVNRPQGAAWDIGAYEYRVDAAVRPKSAGRQSSLNTFIRLRGTGFAVTLPIPAGAADLFDENTCSPPPLFHIIITGSKRTDTTCTQLSNDHLPRDNSSLG
jgi:hypothetical protein